MMARKGKGKQVEKDKGKGKGKAKGKQVASKGKGKGKVKGKGKSSTLALRDEPTDTDTGDEGSATDPTIGNMTATEARQWRGRRARSHSSGVYGANQPREPTRINISDGHIEDDTAKKTVLGMIRERWPMGHYTFNDIDAAYPKWLDDRVDEFFKFYKHQRGQSRRKSRYIVEDHIKLSIKRNMSELKKRVETVAREKGVSKLSLKPPYWSETFWKDLVKYWETNEGHLRRAKVGAENRQRVERLHSAGARSFNSVKAEMTRKNKKPPTKLEAWDKCHQKVGSDPNNPAYTTPAAMHIAERYASILQRMPVEVTQTGERDEPCDWWMEATGVPVGEKPKKNYVVGFPNVRASDLLPTLATRYRDSTRGEAGSSSSAQTQRGSIPDNVYLSIVRNVLTEICVNPDQFARQLSDQEIATFARTALEASDPSTDPSQRLQWNNLIGGEIVHIVGTLIEDILQKTEARVQAAKDRLALEEEKDYTSEDEDMGEDGGEDGGDGAGDDGGEEGEKDGDQSSDVSLSDH